MSVKIVTKRVITSVALVTFSVVFSGCTNLLYQLKDANARVDAINNIFAKTDTVVRESVSVAQKVSTDTLTAKIMETNQDDIKSQVEQLDAVKTELENTQSIFEEFNGLRLPKDYRNVYLVDLAAAKAKRLEAIDNADNLLFKAENLSSAIVNFDSGVNRLQQIADRLSQLPQIDFNQPQTIQLAKDIFQEVSTESRTAQTELNDASASVNVVAFTSLRDAAKNLEDVSVASDALIKTLEALLTAAQTGDSVGFEQAYNDVAVQLDVVVAALDKFQTNFPTDVIDDNNDLTTKAQSMIQTWKDENFKELLRQSGTLKDEIDVLDAKVAAYKK